MDSEINMHYANELRAHLESIIRAYINLQTFADLLNVGTRDIQQYMELEETINDARMLLAKLIGFEED